MHISPEHCFPYEVSKYSFMEQNGSFELLILCINVLSINAVPKVFYSSEGPCWERKKMQLCNVKPYLCVCCRISGFSLIAESQCALMHWPFAPYARCRCAGVWGHLRTVFTTSQRHNCSSSPSRWHDSVKRIWKPRYFRLPPFHWDLISLCDPVVSQRVPVATPKQ